MKIAAKFFSMVLVLSMILSLGCIAFAADPAGTIQVFKTVQKMDMSATNPEETFVFEFESVPAGGKTPAGDEITAVTRIYSGDIPTDPNNRLGIVFDGKETYTYASGSAECTSTKSGTANVGYPGNPGDPDPISENAIYEWIVSEEPGSEAGMTYDRTKYIIVGETDDAGKFTFYFYTEDSLEKVDELSFKNVYVGDEKTRLAVTNDVLEDNKTTHISNKPFAYTAMVNKPDLWPEDSFWYHIFDNNNDLVSSEKASFGQTFGFTLSDGYYAALSLPEGCRYSILETGESNFKPSAEYGIMALSDPKTIDDENKKSVSGNYGENLAVPQVDSKSSTPEERINNDGTTVKFTNVRRNVSPTGILIRNLPYIVMAVVAGAGIVLVVFSKKRRHYEE